MPSKHNGASIWKLVETAYLQCDSSIFSWGAVMNDCAEARGFWSTLDTKKHITYKELNAFK